MNFIVFGNFGNFGNSCTWKICFLSASGSFYITSSNKSCTFFFWDPCSENANKLGSVRGLLIYHLFFFLFSVLIVCFPLFYLQIIYTICIKWTYVSPRLPIHYSVLSFKLFFTSDWFFVYFWFFLKFSLSSSIFSQVQLVYVLLMLRTH